MEANLQPAASLWATTTGRIYHFQAGMTLHPCIWTGAEEKVDTKESPSLEVQAMLAKTTANNKVSTGGASPSTLSSAKPVPLVPLVSLVSLSAVCNQACTLFRKPTVSQTKRASHSRETWHQTSNGFVKTPFPGKADQNAQRLNQGPPKFNQIVDSLIAVFLNLRMPLVDKHLWIETSSSLN